MYQLRLSIKATDNSEVYGIINDEIIVEIFHFKEFDAANYFANYIQHCIDDYICEVCTGNTECPLKQFQNCQHNIDNMRY